MKIKEQIVNLKKLNLPADTFVVVGSGPLAIRGIREAKDMDAIVTQSAWDEMIKTHKVDLNSWGVEHLCLEHDIEILNPSQSIFGNSKVVRREEIFSQADIFDGIKFMNLEHLKKIKQELSREIDLQDIELIDKYLNHQ